MKKLFTLAVTLSLISSYTLAANARYLNDGSLMINDTIKLEKSKDYVSVPYNAFFAKIPTLVVSISASSDKTLAISQCISQQDMFTCYFNKPIIGDANKIDYIVIANM